MMRLFLVIFAVSTIIYNSDMIYSIPSAAADETEFVTNVTEPDAGLQFHSDNVNGGIGKTYTTQWFDFTVESIKGVSEYAGYVPEEGNILVDIVVTVVCTFDDKVPMGIYDFYVDHISFADYVYPLEAREDTMMPEEYFMNKGETVTYHVVYEIPDGLDEVSLYYVEINELDEEGATFRIGIN